MTDNFEDFAREISSGQQEDSSTSIKRKQFQCPDCKEMLVDSYIEQSPFPEIPCPSCGALIERSSLKELKISSQNERSDSRCEKNLTVTYKSFNTFINEYTKNVSQGGMYIKTQTPFEIGSAIELFLHIPEINDPIRISAEVVHANPSEDNEKDTGIGVKFIEVEESSRQLLITYIKSLQDCG
jgi:type IV pilus assembly protein PilZ